MMLTPPDIGSLTAHELKQRTLADRHDPDAWNELIRRDRAAANVASKVAICNERLLRAELTMHPDTVRAAFALCASQIRTLAPDKVPSAEPDIAIFIFAQRVGLRIPQACIDHHREFSGADHKSPGFGRDGLDGPLPSYGDVG